MTSRERVSIAIAREEPDRVPILFRAICPMEHRWRTPAERAEALLALGADEVLSIAAPMPAHPEVAARVWREEGRPYPVLHKEWVTPGGTLHASVYLTEDWQVDDVPLCSDHAWSRGIDYPVKSAGDLDALDYLLPDPGKADLAAFREQCAALRRDADRLGVLLHGAMHAAPVFAQGLLGGHRSVLAVREERDLFREVLARVHRWSQQGLEVLLDAGVDGVYRSSCYETVDLYAPKDVREFFMPLLESDVRLCHQAGVPLHSFAQTGVQPFLDDYAAIRLDILSSLDTRGPNAVSLAESKARLGGKCCLMGGMDNRDPFLSHPASRMEDTVRQVLRVMAPGGGYILSPAGMIFPEGKEENVLALIDAGRRLGRYPLAL